MSGSADSAASLLVLHALRCGGYAGLPRLAAATGLSAAEVESELIDLAVDGCVTRARGMDSWGLTDKGRDADAQRITAELEEVGARATVQAAFDRFLVLNPELLELCQAWQLRPRGGEVAVNDHSDPAYDARVLGRFADLHERALPICRDLEVALPRFGRYRSRLTHALDRARAGELGYVADTTTAYHTVWAELHEDLLATLGIPR